MAYVPPAYFVLGNFNLLGRIIQDNQAFAHAMQQLIESGSNRDNIGIAEIQAITDDLAHTNPASVAVAIQHGMRFFDAIIWFTLPINQRPAITVSPQVTPIAQRDPNLIATKLFFIAFYLMTRGTVPTSDAHTVGTDIPSILGNMYQMNLSPNDLVDHMSSFNMRRLNNQWIRYIDWTRLNIIPRNRFGLGIAGYRMFAPFKMLPPDDTVQNNINITLAARDEAYATARLIATSPSDWAIHPITRNPAVVTAMGSLNGNLANLMLACYSQANLQAMTNQRIIYAIPVYNARFTNFLTWNVGMVNFLNNPIILN